MRPFPDAEHPSGQQLHAGSGVGRGRLGQEIGLETFMS